MRLLAALLALLIASVPAMAQDTKAVCLPLEAHQAILLDLHELRGKDGKGGLRARVRLLETNLDLHRKQVVDLQLNADLAVQAKDVAKDSLGAAVRGRRKAEEDRDAWHRAPALWIAVGLLGALGLAIAVDKIQE